MDMANTTGTSSHKYCGSDKQIGDRTRVNILVSFVLFHLGQLTLKHQEHYKVRPRTLQSFGYNKLTRPGLVVLFVLFAVGQ